MGYEQVVPPVPDRQQELEGLQRLETSWLNQPYYKYYMNESLRQPKIIYSQRINKVYSHYWFNFAISALVLAPFALLARRFFLLRKGVPMTYFQYYDSRFRPDNQFRTKRFLKFVLPTHLVCTSVLAWGLTDYEPVFDKYLQFFHKPPRMM